MSRFTGIAAAALAGIALLAGTASARQITGAGASFPNPIRQKWGEAGRRRSACS